MVTARWTPVVNADAVRYDVHIDTSDSTPSPSTLISETSLSFMVITRMADGTALPIDTNLYVKVVAKDDDGSAVSSSAGIGQAKLVELGDVGNVPYNAITDGAIPTGTPNTPTLTTGPTYIMANWVHSTNDDQLTYEIHMNTTPAFTPTGATYVQETTSNFCFIRADAAGNPLNYTNTSYIKIVMKDLDGAAVNPSAEASATVPRVDTGDIKPLVEDTAFIDEAHIVDLAVTNAKIGALAVDNAKINDLEVSKLTAVSAFLDVALIDNASITSAKIDTLDAAKITTGTMNAARIGAGTIGAETIVLNGASSILMSSNYVAGTSGWQIKGDGDAEFVGLSVDSIDAGTGNTSAHINTSGQLWVGNSAYASAPFQVDNDGDLTCANLVVTGTHNINSATVTTTGTNTVTYASGTTFNMDGTTNLGGSATISGTNGGKLEVNGAAGSGVNLYGGKIGFFSAVSSPYNTQMVTINSAGTTINTGTLTFSSGTSIGHTGTLDIDELRLTTESTFNPRIQPRTGSATYLAISAPRIDLQSSDIDMGTKINVAGSATNPGIGATSGNLRLQANGHAFTGVEVTPNSTTGVNIYFRSTPSASNPVVANGAGAALRSILVSSSTERIKKNITPLAGGMDVIRQIRPIQFESIFSRDAHLGTMWGFSAENLDSVNDHLASYDEDGLPGGIDHPAITAQTVLAVQQLEERIKALENA
jgi:hypothetical protein